MPYSGAQFDIVVAEVKDKENNLLRVGKLNFDEL
jgi:hypothetical protein